MRQHNDLRKYADIAEIFAEALAAGGGHVDFDTYAQAVRWRARAYYYRKLLGALSMTKEHSDDPEERLTAGLTPYDDFYLTLRELRVTILVETPVHGRFTPKA